MKKTLILLVALIVLVVGAAQEYGPVVTNLTNTMTPSQYLQLSTSATNMGGFWTWTYDLTPLAGADDITAFQINLGATEISQILAVPAVYDVTNATNTTTSNWVAVYTGKSYIRWVDAFGNQPLTTGNTYRFTFDHPWGPVEDHFASALGPNGYTGIAPGPAQPAVPEPSAFVLGALGLSSLIGGLKLRKKS